MADADETGMALDDAEYVNVDGSDVQIKVEAGRKAMESQMSIASVAQVQRPEPKIDPSLMFRKPLSIVKIRVKDQEFHLHKDLLTLHCKYFDKALNGPFVEGQSQSVHLDDISGTDFGFFVDILHRAFFNRNFVLRKEHTGGTLSTKQILTLWQLADRFCSDSITKLAKESLDHRLSLYSETQWRKLYEKRTSADLEDRVRRLQEAYFMCIELGLPFKDDVVAATANCPAQLYTDTVHVFEQDFMVEVSSKMMMKYADMNLTKKRTAQEALDNS